MLNSVLWIGIMTAAVSSVAAYVMTDSLLWGFVAYSGAGMAVLTALLLTELFSGEAPAEEYEADHPIGEPGV